MAIVMSMNYRELYNITAGVYMAFNNKTDKRILSVTHKQNKIDKTELIVPLNEYKNWTKENFIVANLYINFVKSPSSLIETFNLLKSLDKKYVNDFKDKIINYRRFLIEDIDIIKTTEGSTPGLDVMINLYRENKIKWFTFYFYLIASNADMDKLSRSRLNGFLLKKINKLLLYVSFSEKSKDLIKELINDGINI